MRAGKRSREDAEMQMIRYLTSGMIKWDISAMQRDHRNSRQDSFGQVEQDITNISTVFDERTFWNRSIGAVNITTTFRDDIDGWAEERKVQSIITNDRH